MRVVMFYHSLVSDWNHGNAHFLRGVVSELLSRGHDVQVWEPAEAWSKTNLKQEYGQDAIDGFHRAYPYLASNEYDLKTIDIDSVIDGAQLVLVHEWSDHDLVKRIGEHRARSGRYKLLFHDTHHRSVTDRESMARYDLSNYDGVLAFGHVVREIYRQNGWGRRAWTWHEAADTRVFKPLANQEKTGDLVWIGNWGDEERTAELHEFLLNPVHELRLRTTVHGVRYPDPALKALRDAGIRFAGWLPNYEVPLAFARHRVTVHVPRRPYVEALPGIPTIRPFEAMACGIPLISAPWRDAEGLFSPGEDFLIARNGEEMKRHLRDLLADESMAKALAERGRQKILSRHTCAHRVDELLNIFSQLSQEAA